MLVQSDFPLSIRTDLEVNYRDGMKAATDASYLRLTEIVETTSNSKQEVFYGDKPRFRRWRGERQPQKFFEYKMTLTSDQWESTREFKRKDFNQDQGKRLMDKAREFGGEVELSKQIEFWEFIHNGSSIRGFDSCYLYDFVHVYTDTNGATHGPVQSNMHLGGSQLDATTLQLEMQYYAELQTDQSQKWGTKLTDIVVYDGSANHKAAKELNNSQFTIEVSTARGQMTDNVFKSSFNIIPTVYGLGASEWISFALNMPDYKPVKILSETKNPGFNNFRFTTLGLEDDNQSEQSFYKGIIAMGVEGNFDYNPGYWFTTRLHGSSSYVYTPASNEAQRVLFPN